MKLVSVRMAFVRNARVVLFTFCLHVVCSQYEVPSVNLQALKPKGFRAWINDDSKIKLFVFQGNINSTINKDYVGTLSGEITEPKDGKFIYEDLNVELKVGDVIYYYVLVSVGGVGYTKDDLSYTVDKLVPQSSDIPRVPTCEASITKVRGGSACASEIIFEDDFNSLNQDKWQIEQYIPKNHPIYMSDNIHLKSGGSSARVFLNAMNSYVDSSSMKEYPFITYQKSTVRVTNGALHISTQLQESLPGFNTQSMYTGTLNVFQGCTAPGEFCVKRAMGADIIPPVVSGRITSKSFAFTYGTVYVRAKLPKGDWLYPEILLEPAMKRYGESNYHSGVIKIAAARGNTLLYANSTDYSNKILYGGPIMDTQCRDTLLKTKLSGRSNWGDDFHLFAMRWKPDSITLLVDGEEWGRVETGLNGLRNLFPRNCNIPRELLSMGSSIAPFEDHFYLTLGLAAGGITEFPDDSYTTADHPKPWRNGGRKAMMQFWQDSSWFSTWTQSELVIDSIRVVAL